MMEQNQTLKITPFGIEEVQIANLVAENDPILAQVCQDWDFSNPPEDAIKLAKTLINTMKTYSGLGLAAPQIGKPYRVFCIGFDKQIQVCFNPVILEKKGSVQKGSEGCLSYPGLYLNNVPRHSIVDVEFYMPDGTKKNETYGGMTARCFQHELSHLNGKTFLDEVGPLQRQLALEKRRKLIKKLDRQARRNK